MTEFPYLIVVGIIAFHVGLVALIIVYVCRKYRCCACSCFISCCSDDVTSQRQRETVIDFNTLGNPDDSATNSASLRTRANLIEAMDPSDPGIQHINRFLGRSYFLNDNDNNNESDIGMMHIRRALGLVHPEQAQTSNMRRHSDSNSAQGNLTPLTHRSTDSLENPGSRFAVPLSLHRTAQADLDRANSNPSILSTEGVRATDQESASSCDLSDQLPTYQEAITLLAKQESEINDVPPRYEDVISDGTEST